MNTTRRSAKSSIEGDIDPLTLEYHVPTVVVGVKLEIGVWSNESIIF